MLCDLENKLFSIRDIISQSSKELENKLDNFKDKSQLSEKIEELLNQFNKNKPPKSPELPYNSTINLKFNKIQNSNSFYKWYIIYY